MIPIRDNQPSSCFPVVTYILMGINLLVFILQIQIGFNNDVFFYSYGLVPAKYTVHEMAQHFSPANQLFSIFLICSCMAVFCISSEICGFYIYLETMLKSILVH